MKNNQQLLKEMMCEELANELLEGGKIISAFCLDIPGTGFILLEKSEPTKEDGDERMFYFSKYGILKLKSYDKPSLFLATQYTKMSKREVIKRSHRKD